MTVLHPSLDLGALLEPDSIAIIGASDRGDSPGARLTAAVARSGFSGAVHAVNPRELALEGMRWAPSVVDIGEPVDLACFAVPAPAAVDAFEALCERGLRAAVVFSSGFSEAGKEGAALERRLIDVAVAHDVALCGPNTAGVISMATGFVGSFTHAIDAGPPPPGSLMVITQSGAIGGLLLMRLRERALGISHWISVGNGAVLDVPDYLEYAAGDSATNSVALFLEGINDGSRFRAAAERCRAAGKQVFAFKAGTTDAGARAARSHTGKLAGSDAVYEGVLRQLGIVRAGGLEELVDLGQARSWLPAAPFGRRGVVLSVSGAGCTILADEIAHAGLQLATLSEATRAELARRLPGFSQHGNPVDLTGAALIDLGILRDVIAATIGDPGVDFAIVSFATNIAPEFAHAVADAAGADKPLVVVLPGDHSSALPMRTVFNARGIPHYREFNAAAVVLGRLATRSAEPPMRPGEPPAGDSQGEWIAGLEALALLAQAGVPVARGGRAATPRDARDLAESIGGEVVIKIDHPLVLHKTEVGGVRVGVPVAEVEAVCEEMRGALTAHGVQFEPDGRFLVQERIEGGLETLLGLVEDPTFGPVVSLGPGGTLVELVGDVAFRALPAGDDEVRDAIGATRLGALLVEHREGPRDADALVELTGAFLKLIEADRTIVEADLNPVLVRAAGDGCVVVDARLRRTATISGPDALTSAPADSILYTGYKEEGE